MKSVSALILVCAFVCASAQFGVKGGSGSSSGSQGAGFKSFFPRFTPGSIQEKKEQLQFANVDDGSSSGFVQPVNQVQPVSQVVAQPVSQVVAQPVGQVVAQPVGQTFVQSAGQDFAGVVSDAAQGVLVPSSGAVSSFSQVPVSVVSQPQFVQSVPAFQSFVPSFQQAVQTVQSVPSTFAAGTTKFFQPAERFVFENRQPAQFVQFDAPSTGAGFPGFTQNIVHLSSARPQTTFQTVPSFVSNSGSSSGSSGADFGSNFGSQVPQAVGKVVKQVSGSVVSQPLSSFASFPSTVPVASFNVAKPSTQFGSAGKVFTDNRLSGFSGQQPAVISQEKQLADTVQTTEW